MNLFEGPTKVIYLDRCRRFFKGKPELEAVAWFRDHVCYLKNYTVDADNLSFTLEKDPGENVFLRNGIRKEGTLPAPHFSCAEYGEKIHTIATTRRNELLFRYRHETFHLPDYPFPARHFAITPRFRELMDRLSLLIEDLPEEGTADRLDLLALEMAAECRISSEKNEKTAVDPRIERLAADLMLYPEKNMNIASEAIRLGFSRASFYREWAKYSEEPPYHFLLKNRLRIVQTLLRETDLSIKEISLRAGFTSPAVLAESFERIFGSSLHDWRMKNDF